MECCAGIVTRIGYTSVLTAVHIFEIKKILDSNVFKSLNTSNKAYWKRYNKIFRMFELFNAVSLTGAA